MEYIAALHFNQAKGKASGNNYHMIWHNKTHFGLCSAYQNLVGKTKNDWKQWTIIQLHKNTHWIESLRKQCGERERNSSSRR